MTGPRERANTLLLLASVAMVLAPHMRHLPPWISLVCVGTLAWRALITVTRRRQPPALVLLPLALLAMLGVQFSFGGLLGRDAGVAMLVLLVAFKTLEMHARRDLFTVIFLCLFLMLTHFFHAQSAATALWMVGTLWLLLCAQLSWQFTDSMPSLALRLALVGRMLLMAAPLAALLLVLIPHGSNDGRSDTDSATAQTGLSERMAPGQLAQLALSDAPVFTVRFLGQLPQRVRLYWRGPVLDSFDGHAWSRGSYPSSGSGMQIKVDGPSFPYEITLEPSQTRWLMTMELPDELPQLADHEVQLSPQFELTTRAPITTRQRYRASARADYSFGHNMTQQQLGRWLQLPHGPNPRAWQAGQALRALPDPGMRVAAVLDLFRAQPFRYTLSPPTLGKDSIDGFLFASQAGFCEHFAGAFVFLMRAAGVPARVVTGYQGGSALSDTGALLVRQSDAHAWAEVWLHRRGWVRVDPTAVVAPERVQLGQRLSAAQPAPFTLAALRASLRADTEVLAGVALVLGALLGWSLLRRWQRQPARHPNDALYSALCQRLARFDLARAPHEGPHSYAERVARASTLTPGARAAALAFLHCYGTWRYTREGATPDVTATLKQNLSQVR